MIEDFGTHFDGTPVKKAVISNGDLSASILTYGASLQDLRLKGHPSALVLGFTDLQAYQQNPYFGAMVGRVANRISHGRFEIDSEHFQTDKNWLRKHTLHGGSSGIDKLNWEVIDYSTDQITLQTIDAEDNSGFPGDCKITCTYAITEDNSLVIEATAISTKDTLCNLAHHSYFNLSGATNILEHELKIIGDHYLPVDEELIPTGEIKLVKNTEFDFAQVRKIGSGDFQDFDHNYCFEKEPETETKLAILRSPQSGISMTIHSTETGLQVYSGKGIDVQPSDKSGTIFGPYQGIALEPQSWPDGINHEGFPSSILRAGDTYFQRSVFSFNRS